MEGDVGELRDVSPGPDHLVMHIVAVPTFMLCNVLAVIGAAMLAPILFFAGVVVLTVGAIGAQGRGHRFKSVPTQPFAGSVDLSKWLFRSEEHTSELQSRLHLVCRLLLEKKIRRTLVGVILFGVTLLAHDLPCAILCCSHNCHLDFTMTPQPQVYELTFCLYP